MNKNRFATIILIVAYLLLIPGVSQPILTLQGTVDKAQLVDLGKQVVAGNPGIAPMISGMALSLLDNLQVSGSIQAYEKSRSILGTVSELFRSKHFIVGFLVMLFSVVVPLLKGGLLLSSQLSKHAAWKQRSFKIASLISKWSMADVFVVAVIVAFLAANASQDMGEIFSLNAAFGSGFYFFLGYCLLSLISAQLMHSHPSKE